MRGRLKDAVFGCSVGVTLALAVFKWAFFNLENKVYVRLTGLRLQASGFGRFSYSK